MKKVLIIEGDVERFLTSLCDLALKGHGFQAFSVVKEIEKAIQSLELPPSPGESQ